MVQDFLAVLFALEVDAAVIEHQNNPSTKGLF
jgi:hypothetical protein